MMDLRALEFHSDYVETLQEYAGPKLSENIDQLMSYEHDPQMFELLGKCTFVWKDKVVPRKITALQDYEGKTRVIAIGDYWTQTALRPLHNHLMRCLSKIKEDCSFDHQSFISKLNMSGNTMYSFDLTNATDRFPLEFQGEVIKWIIGEERGEH